MLTSSLAAAAYAAVAAPGRAGVAGRARESLLDPRFSLLGALRGLRTSPPRLPFWGVAVNHYEQQQE